MKILFEHKRVVPALKYGGTERILYWLMKELVASGHEVYLIGHPNSKVDDIGVKLIPRTERSHPDWRVLVPKSIDLIHLFVTPPFEDCGAPVMTTIHGNGAPGEEFTKNTVFLSEGHARNHGSDCFVYNGLDFSEYSFKGRANSSWNSFLFLGKARWKIKNVTHCIKACKKLKKRLDIAGGSGISLSSHIRWNGMVDQNNKLELLRNVDALLFPVRWNEPFGVAIIEAFSQGVPVIGSSYGSLKELIIPEAGAICESYEHFLEVLAGSTNHYDPGEIREYAENNFSSKIMTNNYLKLYEKVIAGESLNSEVPKAILEKDPQKLLPF